MFNHQCILNTRIPQIQINERVAWVHTSNEVYSAKSGYHFCFNRDDNHVDDRYAQGWSKLWKLQVPQKAKYFMWRICKNNIPTRYLLRSKGVQTTILCPFCNSDVEHLRHVFIECLDARRCWLTTDLNLDVSEIEELLVWLLEQLCTAPNAKLVTMTKVIWGIWMARNKLVWENRKMEPGIAMDVSSRLISEWQAAQRIEERKVTTTAPNTDKAKAKWRSPGFQIGWALRNDEGNFIIGMNKNLEGYASVMEAEALGVSEALSCLKAKEMKRVVVETDPLNVVHALGKGTKYQLEVDNVFELVSYYFTGK